MDMARACVVVCAYGSDAMHSSFSRLSYFVYTPGCGGWHTFYPGFLLYFDTGHIACVRRASLFWSGACFLLFLPSFPLVLTGCIAAFTSTCPSGWRWVWGIGCLEGGSCCSPLRVFCICALSTFRCHFWPLLVWFLGLGMFLSAPLGLLLRFWVGC